MERTEIPVLWRKPPVNRNLRSCGRRASALLCSFATCFVDFRASSRLKPRH